MKQIDTQGLADVNESGLPTTCLLDSRSTTEQRMNFLDEWSQAQLVLFGGKGGVGKTSLTAATAMAIAQRSTSLGHRILVMSVDPAHSLADSLDQPVGPKPVPVNQIDNLWAMELDGASLVESFKRENDESLHTLLDRGTLLDRLDTDSFLNLTLPGVDEVMGVVEIARLLDEDQWDLILVDTAPTGHALRFLATPKAMQQWLEALDVIQEKHRYLKRRFGSGRRLSSDAAEQFLTRFDRKVERARIILQQRGRTEFVPVTIAEPMALAETERLLQELASLGMHPKRLIVNQWVESVECPFCAARSCRQRSALAHSAKLSDLEVLPIPLFPGEVCGPQGLSHVVDALDRLTAQPVAVNDLAHASPPAPIQAPRGTSQEHGKPLVLRDGVRFIFFGGKGGVGKTSLAAAAGLHLAKAHPDKRVVVFSTDPAHSLADSFGAPLGPELTSVLADNLFACEQNAETLFERFRNRYSDSISEIFAGLTSDGVEVQFEQESLQQLASLSPPGVDEIMFLASVMDLADSGKGDLFVLDTAPTGHALRLLELPKLAHDWLQAIFRVMFKHGHAASREMFALARSVRRFQAILTDAAQAEFVLVTIAETMALRESQRLLEQLANLQVGCRSVVFNKLIPKNECDFCRQTRRCQEHHVAGFQKTHPELDVISLPMFPRPIAGQDSLKKLQFALFNSGRR